MSDPGLTLAGQATHGPPDQPLPDDAGRSDLLAIIGLLTFENDALRHAHVSGYTTTLRTFTPIDLDRGRSVCATATRNGRGVEVRLES